MVDRKLHFKFQTKCGTIEYMSGPDIFRLKVQALLYGYDQGYFRDVTRRNAVPETFILALV